MASLFANEEETRAFLEEIKSKTNYPDGHFYIQIASREKYGGVNRIFVRKLCTFDKIIETIHDSTPYRGFYNDGIKVPQDSLVVYMTPEPRDEQKAGKVLCANFILKADNVEFKINSNFLSECQKNPLERQILDIDIDVKSKYLDVVQYLEEIKLIPDLTIESRGGYHLLCYNIPSAQNKGVYQMSQRIGDIDLLKNSMIPIPGTLQGGVEVKWIRS